MRFLNILSQKRGFTIAVLATIFFITLWLTLPSSPHRYLLTSFSLDEPLPIPFHSNSRLLPFRYWNHRSLYPHHYSDNTCMKVPEVSDLKYAANSWQLLKVENGSVYIYGAYWDPRFEEPFVRILVYTDVVPVPQLFCQLWFPHDSEPQTEPAEAIYGWQPAWGGPTLGVNEPYILTCKCRRHLPEKAIPPIAAAVVTAPCGTATNALDIQNAPFTDPLDFKQETKAPKNATSVAVCVKWLHFRVDVSISVIEWMELMKAFGADKVYLYIVRMHPNTRRVLKYYEDIGLAVVTELSHPPQISGLEQSTGSRDFRDMRRELLPLNDCLYRSIGKHDWLLAIDVDEIIVPAPAENWADLIEKEIVVATEDNGFPFDALVFPNYFVLDGAQRDLVGPAQTRLLSHTWRSKNPSPPGEAVKSFFNTATVTAMHNHSPMSCYKNCNFRDVNATGPGRMLHFRSKCSYDNDDCPELHDVIRDDILDKYRDNILEEINQVLKKLGFKSLE